MTTPNSSDCPACRALLRDLAELVQQTRAAQVLYYRTRCPSSLDAARKLERRLDAMIADILYPSAPGLFDSPLAVSDYPSDDRPQEQ